MRRSSVSSPCRSWKALHAESDGPRSCTYFVLTTPMTARPVGAEAVPQHGSPKRGYGFGVLRPALGVGAEVERAEVDDDPAERRAVAAEELRRGVHRDVGAEVARALQVGGRDGVVDHEGHAGGVGDVGELRTSSTCASGLVTDSAKNSRVSGRIAARQASASSWSTKVTSMPQSAKVSCSRSIVPPYSCLAATMCSPCLARARSASGDGGLAGGDAGGGDAALELGDALLEHEHGGVGGAAVDVAVAAEREQVARVA